MILLLKSVLLVGLFFFLMSFLPVISFTVTRKLKDLKVRHLVILDIALVGFLIKWGCIYIQTYKEHQARLFIEKRRSKQEHRLYILLLHMHHLI